MKLYYCIVFRSKRYWNYISLKHYKEIWLAYRKTRGLFGPTGQDLNRKCYWQKYHNVKVKYSKKCRNNAFKYVVFRVFRLPQHLLLDCFSVSVFVTMFQYAAKSISAAANISRAPLLSFRHYCQKTPTKLRVSEALAGAQLGENVKVQVTLSFGFNAWYFLIICIYIHFTAEATVEIIYGVFFVTFRLS